jgi:putative transposase
MPELYALRIYRFSADYRSESPLAAACQAINEWKEDCNHHRPHSAIGNIPPAEYSVKSLLEKQAA